jgi:PTH1 family peptidyl-tRNA hydrolase
MASKDSIPDTPIQVVIGLGNPGRDYEGTRHNVGFEIVDRLARATGADWRTEKKWKAEVAKCADGTILVKPQTFMNLSGQAAAAVGGFYKIPPTSMLVVYDDVDIPLGQLRFRANGSAGGHNGIKSLIQSLGGDRFPRLKFGIGQQPEEGENGADSSARRSMIGHVLGKFAASEEEVLQNSLANAVDAVNCALARGLAVAMNQFNQKAKKPAQAKPTQPQKHNPSAVENAPENPEPDPEPKPESPS